MIESYDDDDVVCFMDAYDTLVFPAIKNISKVESFLYIYFLSSSSSSIAVLSKVTNSNCILW
jgi:hypothetical protein